MENKKAKPSIAIIGGDIRQLIVAKEFSKNGYHVTAFGFDSCENDYGNIEKCDDLNAAITNAKIIILPLPCSMDGVWLNCPFTTAEIKLSHIINNMCKGQVLFGGKISEKINNEAKEKGILVYDYYNREELVIMNAIPTAEGAISIAMQECQHTLHSSKCAVIGFGRIGKVLSHTLDALGANVSVFARSFEAFSWIKAYGLVDEKISSLEEKIGEFDIIFNTVPYRLLDETTLKNVKKGALIIDLASTPGGVDRDYAKKENINVIWALSLPGKVAPISAGRIIKETVENILLENGADI